MPADSPQPPSAEAPSGIAPPPSRGTLAPGAAADIAAAWDRHTGAVSRRERAPDESGTEPALDEARAILARSALGRLLLATAEQHGIRIIGDKEPKTYGYYDPQRGVVSVNPELTIGKRVATLAHELRHAWQDKAAGWFGAPLHPRDEVWLQRALEADAETASAIACWELKQAGEPRPLEEHAGSEYGDIARAFLHSAEERPSAAVDGSAARAAFDQWFSKPWRRNSYDQSIVTSIEDELYAYAAQGRKGYRAVTAEALTSLGALPNAVNYLRLRGDPALDGAYYQEGLAAETLDRLAHVENRVGVKAEPPAPGAPIPADGIAQGAPAALARAARHRGPGRG